MLPFEGYYGLPSNISNHNEFIQEPNPPTDGGDWTSTSGSKSPTKKLESASKKHAVAEQQRRRRINRHYHTLRQFFPNLPKADKASVLTETVRYVKELKKMAADVSLRQDGGDGWSVFLPNENDVAAVSYCDGRNEGNLLKATVCCEDRPGLNRDLMEAVRFVRGRAVRAEIATIGGRTKVVVVVQRRQSCGGGGSGEEDVGSLRRALKAVVENRGLGCNRLMGPTLSSTKWTGLGLELLGNKRPWICGSMNDGLSDGLLFRSI